MRAKLSEDNVRNFTGAPIPREEDARLLRGRGSYVDDLHLEGMLHAAIFRSFQPPMSHQTRGNE